MTMGVFCLFLSGLLGGYALGLLARRDAEEDDRPRQPFLPPTRSLYDPAQKHWWN